MECINMKSKYIFVLAHKVEIVMCNVIICKIIAKRKSNDLLQACV